MRASRALFGSTLALIAALTAVGPSAGAGAADGAGGAAPPNPTVGALYLPSVLGLGPTLRLPHYCTAGVVHSPGRNLLITAAHCVIGTGVGTEFVPAYDGGIAAYGAWDVVRAYVDRRWQAHRDPLDDVAFLQVANRGRSRVEDVVGGNVLAFAPHAGSSVTVSGYVLGTGAPVTCTARVRYTGAYPTFSCPGFADGTSGSPWLANGSVMGVIGGLEQGGCTSSTSYSAPFGRDVRELFERAVAGGAGDLAPLALNPGC